MRKRIGQLVVLGLLAGLRVRAQDAASTPFRESRPPAESPAPERSAAATPAPSERPTPAAQVEEEATPPAAAASPGATPIPVQRAQPVSRPTLAPVRAMSPRPPNTKPVPKPEQRAEARPAAPERRAEASGNVGETIKQLEQQWESAIAKHDTSIIDRVVADDFVGVSSTGRIGDKSTLIYEAKRDKNTYKTASARQMTVHTFGSHVAVVLGLTKESGTTASGRPFDHTYRFTDTWMERDGTWQCIAAHAAVAGKR